jgi:hypothetical protein
MQMPRSLFIGIGLTENTGNTENTLHTYSNRRKIVAEPKGPTVVCLRLLRAGGIGGAEGILMVLG